MLAKINKKFNIFTSIRKSVKLPPITPSTPKKTSKTTNDLNKTLNGTSVAIKDLICTTKEPTTCSSASLSHYISPFNATVVDLLEASGAEIVGKTNMDEFGMGGANTNSYFGTTLNPKYEEKTVSGGSSGGSAAAVAAGACDFALGTDTGGSVRLPAAYCGVYGFKPSYGRISRWGVIPYAQSLDTVGIFAKDVSLVSKVFKVLDVPDHKDLTCLNASQRSKISADTAEFDSKRLRIGISPEYLAKGTSKEVLDMVSAVCSTLLTHLSAKIVPVSLPTLPVSIPAYFTLAYSEAASNLARLDGVRYGSALEFTSYNEYISQNRSLFGQEVQKRILVGNSNLSSDSYRHRYLKAISIRKQLSREFDAAFSASEAAQSQKETSNSTKVDFIIAPVSSGGPMTLQEFHKTEEQDPISTYVNDAFLVPASLARLPAISVPWGNLGVQIIGKYGNDEGVLQLASVIDGLR